MTFHQNESNQELSKFYKRIRLHLDDIEPKGDNSNYIVIHDDETVPDEELYGIISKDELTRVLESYDKQQESQDLRDKPVACDKVVGANYAKLLYSKPGFHHLGSTSHLVKQLDIKDIHRNCFLAGHSVLCPSAGEDIAALKKHYDRAIIKQITDRGIGYLNISELDSARREINKAHEMDPSNGDVLAAWARYYCAKKEYGDAIKFYKSALNHGPHDEDTVKLYLSDTLYHHGFVKYTKHQYREAKESFIDALRYNPGNQGALLHRNLCEDALCRSTVFSTHRPLYRK